MKRNSMHILYGIILCVMIGVVAHVLSVYLSVASVAIAILIGLIVGNSVQLGERFKPGITFSERRVLSLAIALMGVNLNYVILKELGYKALVLIIAAMSATIVSSIFLAKIMKVNSKLALLIGIGNGVCGSSAIAATERIIGAREEDVGISIAIVNFLGIIGMFLLPFLGAVILKSTDINIGIVIGNTLQTVGQVIAAGFSVSAAAGQTATIVKMGRILMLTPLILILLSVFSDRTVGKPTQAQEAKRQGLPFFIVGFIFFSLVSTLHVLPEMYIKVLGNISHYALIVAMASIGLKITFGSILREGKAALLMGSVIFILQILFSATVVWALFR